MAEGAGGTEAEMPEELPEEAPKGRGKITKIVAIAVALIVAGVVVWWFVFSNVAPVADFGHQSVDLRLTVNGELSRDPDGTIAAYSWDWGDDTPLGTGIRSAHEYAQVGTYVVTLTVADNRGASGSASKSVLIEIKPTAVFIARHDRFTVSFDASDSFSSGGAAITSYSWDFGDGETATGPLVTHTYATPGRRTVKLSVTDAGGLVGNATRYVSPADTTVDILADQLFEAGCPYNPYWELRKDSYGDVLLRNEVPCTSFYPWVLFNGPIEFQPLNPSDVYSIYRWDVRVRNHPGYTLDEPVLLPVFNASVSPLPDSYIQLNLTFDYLNSSTFALYAGTPFALNDALSDGFGYLVEGSVTMDFEMSKRIFGVVASNATEAQAWWNGATLPGRPAGTLEGRFASWLESMANTKYDIYNAFEWFYQSDITDLNATVAPDGTTTVAVFIDGWGYETLLARWFYWGKADYSQAVNLPYGSIEPEGWMPMEACWCEDSKINGRIASGLDLDYETRMTYHLVASADPGADGLWRTSDDLAAWVLEPWLMDYVPRLGSGSIAEDGFGNSELFWYEGQTSVYTSPGSYSYGQPYEYTVAMARWKFDAGSTYTVVVPRLDVPWYDPALSTWDPDAKIGRYTTFNAPMTLRSVKPAGDYYLWDARAKVLSLAGPHDWGTTSVPLQGAPWIEFAPETVG